MIMIERLDVAPLAWVYLEPSAYTEHELVLDRAYLPGGQTAESETPSRIDRCC